MGPVTGRALTLALTALAVVLAAHGLFAVGAGILGARLAAAARGPARKPRVPGRRAAVAAALGAVPTFALLCPAAAAVVVTLAFLAAVIALAGRCSRLHREGCLIWGTA